MKPELESSWIWIDAICINQHCKEERQVQVRSMPDVYTTAQKVLIWLGAAEDESNLAMDNMPSLVEILSSIELGTKTIRSLPPRDHHIWTALVKLFQRPWFRRLWIMQEAILAKGSYVLCGDRTLTVSIIEDFAEMISKFYPAILYQHGESNLGTKLSGFVCTSQLKTLRNFLPTEDLTFFSSLLSITREREVEEALDRIYGLLALMPKQVLNAVTVSYEWKPWQGYLNFCQWFIQHETSLTLLSMAPSIEPLKELPSWCPNFHSPSTEGILYSQSLGYSAGFSDRSNRRSTIRLSEDGNAIMIPGFRLDSVKKVVKSHFAISESASQTENFGPNGTAARNLMWDSECIDLFKEASSTERSTPENLEIHARVLCANHFHPTEPVPPTLSIQASYLSLKEFWIHLSSHIDPNEKHTVNTTEEHESQRKYNNAITLQGKRKYFSTVKGRVGMGPSQLQPRDVICVFESGASLFVLRFDTEGKKARLVGDAFMYGCMDLETMPVDPKEAWEEFVVT